MDCILAAAVVILLLVIAALCVKIRLMQISAEEIRTAFHERLETDTNTLIGISGRDRALRRLASDINDQLRLLRAQRQRYQQGDRQVKDAVTNLSHDLRTPLTAICGYLELLERQNLTPDAQRYLRYIEERAQTMKDMTEELFRYSLAVSEPRLELRPVDLRRALEDALLSFYGAFDQAGITPKLSLAQPERTFLLDVTALNRILGNIVSNALKYSGGDFIVTLDKEGRIACSNLAPGLDALDAGRMFDRYYTVDAARHSTGLGLSIARRLTEQMSGTIRAEYSDGRLTVILDFSQTEAVS